MVRIRIVLLISLLLAACVLPAAAQQSPATNVIVPPLVKFGGLLSDINGNPLAGVVGVTFSLYKDSQGGAPLWMETQNVQSDKTGHYSVMLGSTTSQGLPADLFVSGEAHWLGVQIEGQAEQPRVMLLSVPYAIKAGDAETVGGLPASAFVLVAPASSLSSNSGSATVAGAASSSAPGASPLTGTLTGVGTTDFLPLWTSSSNIGNSVLFQSGTGSTAKIGINTTTPGATLDVKGGTNIEGLLDLPATGTATASGGKISQAQNFVASSYNSGTAAAVSQTFQWRAEPAGNNTATPSGTLSLLFGSGTSSPAETGLKLSNKGLFSFATGQTFPGTGTLTGVTTASGSGLTGGGTGGTLNLALTNACAANQVLQWSGTAWACSSAGTGTITGITAGTDLTGGGKSGTVTLNLDTTKIPQLGAANIFNGDQTVNGTLVVSSSSTYHPFLVQSSSGFGTWLELSNTSAGGQTWNILSAASGNAEGAGNLGITNLRGGTIFLEGPVNAGGTVTVASAAPTVIGNTGCGGTFGGIGFGANSLSGCANYSLLGDAINTYLNRPKGGQVVFRENNATEMVLASGGNVGIGTTSPSYLLHVNGTARAETGLSLGGNSTLSVDAPGKIGGQFLVANGTVSIGGDTPMSSNPRMTFSASFPGSFCGDFTCGSGSSNNLPGGYLVPDKPILITHISVSFVDPVDPSCGQGATIVVSVDRHQTLYFTLPTGGSSGGFYPISGDFPVLPPLSIGAGSSVYLTMDPSLFCNLGSSGGGNGFANVQYVMQ
jgi:hypothetical protein